VDGGIAVDGGGPARDDARAITFLFLPGHVFFDLHLATHLFVVMEPDRMQSGISQNAGKHPFTTHPTSYT